MPKQKKWVHTKTVKSCAEESTKSVSTICEEVNDEVTEKRASENGLLKRWKSYEDISNMPLRDTNLDKYFSAISLSQDDLRGEADTSFWSTMSLTKYIFCELPYFMDPNVGLLNNLPSLCSRDEIAKHWGREPSALDKLERTTHLQSFKAPVIVLFGGINPMNPTDYQIGGAVLRYICGEHCWQLFDMMPEPRNYHAAVLMKNAVYITGGTNPLLRHYGEMIATTSTFCFDVENLKWHYCAEMNEGRALHAMVASYESLFVCGGRGSNGRILSSVERYNPKDNTWTTITNLPEPRMGLSATLFHHSLWIFGGFTVADEFPRSLLETVCSFNLNSEIWDCEEPLPEPIAFNAAVVIEDEIWLYGGATLVKSRSNTYLLSTGVVYVFNKGQWDKPTRLSLPRHSLSCAKIGSSAFLIGGMTTSSNEATRIVETVDSFTGLVTEEVPLPLPIAGSAAIGLPLITHNKKVPKKKYFRKLKEEKTHKKTNSPVHFSSSSEESKNNVDVEDSCISEEHSQLQYCSKSQHPLNKSCNVSEKLNHSKKFHTHISCCPSESESESEIRESCKKSCHRHSEGRSPPCSTHTTSRRIHKIVKSETHSSELSDVSNSETDVEGSCEEFCGRKHHSTHKSPCFYRAVSKIKNETVKSHSSEIPGDFQSEPVKEVHKHFCCHCTKHTSSSSNESSKELHKKLKSPTCNLGLCDEFHSEGGICRHCNLKCKSPSRHLSKKLLNKMKQYKCNSESWDDSHNKRKIEKSHRISHMREQSSSCSPHVDSKHQHRTLKSHKHVSKSFSDSESEIEEFSCTKQRSVIESPCLACPHCSERKKLDKPLKPCMHTSHPIGSQSETEIKELLNDSQNKREESRRFPHKQQHSICKSSISPCPCCTTSDKKSQKTLKSHKHTSKLSSDSQYETEIEESHEEFSNIQQGSSHESPHLVCIHHTDWKELNGPPHSHNLKPAESHSETEIKESSHLSELDESQGKNKVEESHRFSHKQRHSAYRTSKSPCLSAVSKEKLKSHKHTSKLPSGSQSEELDESVEEFTHTQHCSKCDSPQHVCPHHADLKLLGMSPKSYTSKAADCESKTEIKESSHVSELLDDCQSRRQKDGSHRFSHKWHLACKPSMPPCPMSAQSNKKLHKTLKSHKYNSNQSSHSKCKTKVVDSCEESHHMQQSSAHKCSHLICRHRNNLKKMNETPKSCMCTSNPIDSQCKAKINKSCELCELSHQKKKKKSKSFLYLPSHVKIKKLHKTKHSVPVNYQSEMPLCNPFCSYCNSKPKSYSPANLLCNEAKKFQDSHNCTFELATDSHINLAMEGSQGSCDQFSYKPKSKPPYDICHSQSKKWQKSSSSSPKSKLSGHSPLSSSKSCLKKFEKLTSHETRSASKCSSLCVTNTSNISISEHLSHMEHKSSNRDGRHSCKTSCYSHSYHSDHQSPSSSFNLHNIHICEPTGPLPENLDPNLGLIVPGKTSKTSDETMSQEELPVFVYSLDAADCYQEFAMPTILMFGGISLQDPWDQNIGKLILKFHPLKNRWEFVDVLPVIRNYHSATLLDDRIYIIGGYDPTKPVKIGMAARRTVIAYDIHERRWIKRASLSHGRAYHGTVVMHNKLYVIGGKDTSGGLLSSVEVYSPYKDDWEESSPLPCAIMGAAVTCVENDIWVIGGITDRCNYFLLDTVYKYNSCEDEWSTGPTLKQPIGFSTALTVKNTVWLCGGAISGKNVLDSCTDVWMLGPHSSRWEKCFNLSCPKYCSAGVSIESCLYLLGGICSQEKDATAKTDLILTESGEVHPLCPLPTPLTGMACIILPPRSEKVYRTHTMLSLVRNFWSSLAGQNS